MTSPSLVTSWAVCGIAAAAARFVPVPLLDDVIRQRAAQVAVVRTLRAHGRTRSSEPLKALWGEPDGQRRGRGRHVRAVMKRLMLFPVRKYVAVFGAVRGVPNDVMRVVLLARTVDRRLEIGALTTQEEARALRTAIDGAIEGMDLRMLTAGLADGLSQSRGLSASAVAYARRRGAKDADVDVEPDGPVAEGAERVTEVLRRPEIAALLERFDASVDRALAPGGR